MNRLKLILGAGLATCALAALPATASAAEPGPCYKDLCPIDIAQELANDAIDDTERVYDLAIAIVLREYAEFQEFYRDVEDDLNRYLCQQTGDPTYCNH